MEYQCFRSMYLKLTSYIIENLHFSINFFLLHADKYYAWKQIYLKRIILFPCFLLSVFKKKAVFGYNKVNMTNLQISFEKCNGCVYNRKCMLKYNWYAKK